jgi:uncharacterized Zn finger protein
MYISKIIVKGDTDNFYEIAVGTDGATCTCPAYRFGNGAPCKHIRYVAKRVTSKN